jgi:hypothetical protein
MTAMRVMPGVLAALLPVLAPAAQESLPDVGRGRVSGRAVTTYGEPVQEATVTLTRIGPDGLPTTSRSVRTGAAGAWTLDQLAPGRYQLSASKPGFTSGDPLGNRNGLEFSLDAEQSRTGLDITMYRPGRIAGRIIRSDGTAAADVVVTAGLPQPGGPPVLLTAMATTSQWDGRYEITGLPPGDYVVAARQSSRSTLYPGVPDTEPGTPVTLLEGIPAEGIDIWLTPAQRFDLSGRVFWPDGIAVESLSIDYGDPAGARSGVWYVSDPGGLFTLTGLAPGPLVLLARADTAQGPLLGLASTTVTVGTVDDVRIVVDRPGSVEGRVVFDRGEAPSGDAAPTIALIQTLFRVSAVYPAPAAAIERDGRFQLRHALGEYAFEVRGLPPGFRISQVRRGGVPLAGQRVRVGAGEVVGDVEVVVSR